MADVNCSKNIFTSKTFWVNALTFGLSMGGALPPKWSAPILAVVNVALRLVTTQPVTVFPVTDVPDDK